ncbi:MAG TPA: hypothetical protein PKD64_16560 [Pirellulaceae bacterium]|nr:hypothetical protein [Pirellulaceae bacterium]HMO93803.1 hypothetical protein [Pirellulaceae bacterium]HMP70603.1 hypothetical protein [Pirellulaceae bacterium]
MFYNLSHTFLITVFAVSFCIPPNFVLSQDDRPCGPEGRNGILSRLIPQEFHGADFRPACRTHDACYDTFGSSRRECDRQFRDDLLRACDCADRPIACRIVARNMARATRLGGGSAFRRSQSAFY